MNHQFSNWLFLIVAVVFFGACTGTKKTVKDSSDWAEDVVIEIVDDMPNKNKNDNENSNENEDSPKPPKLEDLEPGVDLIKDYRGTRTIYNDLIHTALRVKFDWENAYLNGTARITLSPWYYPTNKLVLDAKGFDVHSVVLESPTAAPPDLEYEYIDSLQLHITLDKTYTKDEEYTIVIGYTAKPNELPKGGGLAITDRKGLYFINPDGSEEGKPQQIWTQGEPESSSCWFPTIDSPNQNTSQEIYMTVQDKYVTLSNGKLMSSTKNQDGTRTDYWRQELPHAPYLFMMGVGEFAVVKDKWKDLLVDYYVEPEYEADAKAIFGKTPKMLDLFTEQLGVDYPWDKYSQIIVRDYVSGAMENTGAVIYGEFVQAKTRDLIDFNSEQIIAHELFHHWFGDLVTCESWANLPLNESFATYGECLWLEAEYGAYEGDHELKNKMSGYLRESERKQVDVIRFYHDQPMDMFDGHSYNKGGCILHMLRMQLGDDAFFDGLKTYLNDNRHQSVEIHNLRLAMEKVSGQDLNWFFNQWFLSSGHPDLDISYDYDAENKVSKVMIKQMQSNKKTPIYRLPLKVDLYMDGDKVVNESIIMTQKEQTFEFKADAEPLLVNVDADKALLGTKMDNKSLDAYFVQFDRAPKYLDKVEALEVIKEEERSDRVVKVFMDALNNDFWSIRNFAIRNYKFDGWEEDGDFLTILEKIAKNDPKSRVRAAAVNKLAKTGDKKYSALFKDIFEKDQSYRVMNTALSSVGELDAEEGLVMAEKAEGNDNLLMSVLNVYKEHGDDSKGSVFERAYKTAKDGGDKWGILSNYADYIVRFDDKTVDSGLALFEDAALTGSPWWVKMGAMQSVAKVMSHYQAQEEELTEKLENVTDAGEKTKLTDTIAALAKRQQVVQGVMGNIFAKNKDERLMRGFQNMMSQ